MVECFCWLKPAFLRYNYNPTSTSSPPTKLTPIHYKFLPGLTHSPPNLIPKSHIPTMFRSVRRLASTHGPPTSTILLRHIYNPTFTSSPPTKLTPIHYKFLPGLTYSPPNLIPKSHIPTMFRSVRRLASTHGPPTS